MGNISANKPPEKFPDRQTCRVQPSLLMDDWFECSNFYGSSCSYRLMFEKYRFCRHPDAKLMLDSRASIQ